MSDSECDDNSGRRALSSSELQFRRLLETLPAGAYTCDADGLITYYNRQALELWGRAPKLNDPVDRYCGSFRLFSPEGARITHDQCWMAKALHTDCEFIGQEIVVEREDGERRTVLAHANPLHDEAGRLIGAVNVLVDISDKQQSERAQALLAAIVESSNDAIISKTLEGRILSWNQGAERLFGYTAEEAIGAPITLIIPPERRDEEVEILARLRRGERVEHFDTVRVTKTGQRLDVSLTISPLRDAAGRVIGASKVGRDVSARKLDERRLLSLKDELAMQVADLGRLHAMSRQLSTTLEMRPILDETLRSAAAIEGAHQGLLSLCNEEDNRLTICASLNLSPDFIEQAERNLSQRVCTLAYRERRRVVVEDIETDPRFSLFKDAAREVGFRAVHSTPLVTRLGKVVGVLTTHFRQPHRPTRRDMRLIDLCARQAADVIENAQLYAQLKEADRRKDEFLAVLAHELRNPLAPICNALQILGMTEDLSPAADRMRQIMERQVEHMVRLIDELLEVSRITRGKIELRKERVDLAAIVRGALETSRPLIESGGHQMAISLHPEQVTVDADPVRLTQVVANLLNNAAKYTDRGGQVWLNVREADGEALISVRDNGVGIPPAMLPRVFDMFAQVDRTLKRSQGGLGIGLTLAKTLVQMHGGRIEVQSAGPGQGSEFTVYLPLAIDPARTEPPIPAGEGEARRRRSLPSRRVLVVDDNDAVTESFSLLLQAIGQQVRVANSAADALSLAQAEPPDVLISDIGMPHMDGYALARLIRQKPGLERVTLVALTGYGQDHDRELAMDAGFDYHLVKPVALPALEELLASLPAPVAK